VQGDDALFPFSEEADEMFDLVRKDVGCEDFDRRGKILSSAMLLLELTKMIRSSFLPSAHTLPLPANHVFLTASHTSTAYSVSVWEKVSGEYSYRKVVPC
jgi:hypothetical protein